MSEFVIVTDSGSDLPEALAQEMGLAVLPMALTLAGKEYARGLEGSDLSLEDFYKALQGGASGSTSMINLLDFTKAFTPFLEAGRDILYIGLSSGLSNTYSMSVMAAEALLRQYPDRKIFTVDTLGASMGEGLLAYLAAVEQKAGKSIEAVYDFAQKTRQSIALWFTVDDLQHLRRGGRISPATTLLGTMLHIKPILHVDDEGHLANVSKARGRKAALTALVDRMAESAVNPREQTVFISHGCCAQDAEFVASLVRERFGTKHIVTGLIGPLIGLHSGPGTVALFFIGNAR